MTGGLALRIVQNVVRLNLTSRPDGQFPIIAFITDIDFESVMSPVTGIMTTLLHCIVYQYISMTEFQK
mgnify:CR=1 FL=1